MDTQDAERQGDAESATEDRFQRLRLIEALLFASAEPLTPRQLAAHLQEPEGDVLGLLQDLAGHYANRGVNLVQRGQAWAFRTAPDTAQILQVERVVKRKLSRAAMETLATIAYHQPVTRAEIEQIRGVSLSKGTFDALLEAGWIKPKGRRQSPGRPVTWGSTDAFLDYFGLESLEALPGKEELKAAGLLDRRPAITAMTSRGALLDEAEVATTAEAAEEEDAEERQEAVVLSPPFGAANSAKEANDEEVLPTAPV